MLLAEAPKTERLGLFKVLIVTSSDNKYVPLLKMMLASIYAHPQSQKIDLACFDLGLSQADLNWLKSEYGAHIATPKIHFGSGSRLSIMDRAVMARPFLRGYFPGYDLYCWLDSDIWIQRWSALDQLLIGALENGLALVHERERAYARDIRLFAWKVKHSLLGYSLRQARRIVLGRSLNAGVFALTARSPIWEAWAKFFQRAYFRTAQVAPHDQFALSLAAYEDGGAAIIEPTANWICARGQPIWDDESASFCVPYAPYSPIGILHLAGPAKRKRYLILRTSGGAFETVLVRGARPESPGTDPLS